MLPDAGIPEDPTADRSYLIRDINVTLMVLSTIFVIARVYVRKFVSNSFGLDDCCAMLSLVSSTPGKRIGGRMADSASVLKVLLLAVAYLDISGTRSPPLFPGRP